MGIIKWRLLIDGADLHVATKDSFICGRSFDGDYERESFGRFVGTTGQCGRHSRDTLKEA